MERDELNDEVLSRVEISRREMVRRLVVGTAFAVPVVSSFDMAALTTSSAQALTPNQLGFFGSNQTFASPHITSAAGVTFTTGQPGSFDVTATGGPNPSIGAVGQLPADVTLVDAGNGSALLSGTPQPGSGGVYPLELTAANGVPPATSQAFTLTVLEAPAIGPTGAASFIAGQPGSLLLIGNGFPLPTIGIQGALPHGLSFAADPVEGVAIISGTPASSEVGTHKLTLTAANGVSPAAQSLLTLKVSRTSAKVDNHFTLSGARVARGGAVKFTATVNAGGSLTALLTAPGHGKVGQQHAKPRRPGPFRVHVSPSRALPTALELTLAVMFKPNGGSPRTIRLHGLRVP